jgi:hypothetical protein
VALGVRLIPMVSTRSMDTREIDAIGLKSDHVKDSCHKNHSSCA